MKRTPILLVMAAFLLALGACAEGEGQGEQGPAEQGPGEPGRDGEPLGVLTLAIANDMDPSVVAPHVGLAWWAVYDPETEPFFATEAVPLSSPHDPVLLSVFQEPPPGSILVSDYDDFQIAIGSVLGFDDRDGDGAFSVGEMGIELPDLLFGYNWTDLLVYVQASPDSPDLNSLFVNPEAFEPGLSRVRLDVCSGKLEFVPMDTPIVLDVFEPTSDFGPPDDVSECEGEDREWVEWEEWGDPEWEGDEEGEGPL